MPIQQFSVVKPGFSLRPRMRFVLPGRSEVLPGRDGNVLAGVALTTLSYFSQWMHSAGQTSMASSSISSSDAPWGL